jgi:hypothetical protein
VIFTVALADGLVLDPSFITTLYVYVVPFTLELPLYLSIDVSVRVDEFLEEQDTLPGHVQA